MAAKGVWQVTRLTLHYCPFSGSSRGAREFVESFLPIFKEQNPSLDIDACIKRGGHPFLTAQYKNSNSRLVDVKNQDVEGILRHAHILRSCHGRRTNQKVRWRHISETASIQGAWKPGMFEKQHVQPGF